MLQYTLVQNESCLYDTDSLYSNIFIHPLKLEMIIIKLNSTIFRMSKKFLIRTSYSFVRVDSNHSMHRKISFLPQRPAYDDVLPDAGKFPCFREILGPKGRKFPCLGKFWALFLRVSIRVYISIYVRLILPVSTIYITGTFFVK